MADVPVRFRGDASDALRASRQAVGAVDQFNVATQRNTRTMMQASRGALAGSGAFRMLGRQIAFASGAFLGTAGLTAALAGALRLSADFERQLNTFQEVAGATGREMRRVSGLAKALGADIRIPGASAADAAETMTALAKGGFDVDEAMAAARGSLQLAAAAEVENAEAATIAARAINAFGLSGGDAMRVADLLAASANASTAEMSDMAFGLAQSAAVAKQFGLSIEDTVVALASLADEGIVGSDAGTSFRVVLQRLVPQTEKAKDKMAELGVRFADAKGNLLPLRDMISQYTTALGRLTPAQRASAVATLFGTDATRAANIILDGGVQKYDAMRVAVTKQGAAQDLAAAKTKGAGGALDALRSTVETAAIDYGTKLLPALESGTRSLTEFVDEASRSPEVRQFFRDAMEFSEQAARMMRDAAVAANEIAEAIGGWDSAFTLILSGFLATKLLRVAGGLSAIGTAAGTGPAGATTKVSGLRAALVGLGRLSAIAIAINLIINKPKFVDDWNLDRSLVEIITGKSPEELYRGVVGAEESLLGRRRTTPGPSGAGAVEAVFGTGAKPGITFSGQKFTHPTSGLADFPAVDIFAKPGTPFTAPEDGQITSVDRSNEGAHSGQIFGAKVYMVGESGTTYFITHIMGVVVKRGQRVKKGQIIGYVTAWKSGASHAHVGVHRGPAMPGTTPARDDRGPGRQPGPGRDPGADDGEKSELLPRGLRLAITEAEGTRGIKDDIVALKRIEAFLEKARTQTKRNSEKRIKIQEELNATRKRLKDLQEGEEPRPFEVPIGLRTKLTRARGTERIQDDIKALRAIQVFLRDALKGSKGQRRLDILEELNQVRASLRDALDLSKPVRDARAKLKPELAALREQIARLPPELQAQLRPRLNALDRQLRNAIKTETVDAVAEKAQAIRDEIVEAIETARDEVEAAVDDMNDKLGSVGDMALEVFDAQADEMVANARKALDVPTPAERELEALRALRDELTRMETMDDINERLAVARRLGDPSLIRQGERELRLAQLDETIAGLEPIADAEGEARDAAMDAEEKRIRDERRSTKRRFEARLEELVRGLQKEGATYEEALPRIQGLLDEFGITGVAAATLVGNYFANDFVKAIEAAARAVGVLKKEVADVIVLTGGAIPPEILATIPGRGSAEAQPMQHGGITPSSVPTHALLHPREAVIPLDSPRGRKLLAEALGGAGTGSGAVVTLVLKDATIFGGNRRKVAEQLAVETNAALGRQRRLGDRRGILGRQR